MGKNSRNSWLDAVKKAFRSPTKDEKKSSRRREEIEAEEEEKRRGKKRWMFGRNFSIETTTIHAKCADSSAVRICSGEEALVRKQPKIENGERRAFEAAIATAAVAEAAITTAKAAVEVIRLGRPSAEDRAAVVIQKAFRGYLARRALMALKGVVKLQALIRGHNVRKRAKMTLQCIQSLVRVQALVCDQRRRLSCEATTLGSMFSRGSMTTSRVSSSLDLDSSELDEIHSLIQKAKECSLKVKDRHHHRSGSHEHLAISLQSPRTPSSTKTSCYHTAETPSYGRRMSMSERGYCAVARPNYMAATASAMARVRPSSTPRQRLSPGRELMNAECSAKKRLSFHVQEDRSKFERYRSVGGIRGCEPYYGTD